MLKSVLIAEDHESANISVQKTLADLSVENTKFTYYCDDALMLITKAHQAGESFDMLITDLSFQEDHRPQKIANGIQLIEAVRKIQPGLKVLVFSAENKTGLIDDLFKTYGINGYVRKGRHDAKELRQAIEAIAAGKRHLIADLRTSIKEKNSYEFSNYDITLITLLSKGMMQKDIPVYLKKNSIKPSGLSSAEKRLNLIREAFEFNNNEQLVAYCKDLGII